jgi:hypothetical protein
VTRPRPRDDTETGLNLARTAADVTSVTLMARIYALTLGLAAAAGWLLGIVVLPLLAWAAIEVCCTAGALLYAPDRRSRARMT